MIRLWRLRRSASARMRSESKTSAETGSAAKRSWSDRASCLARAYVYQGACAWSPAGVVTMSTSLGPAPSLRHARVVKSPSEKRGPESTSTIRRRNPRAA